MSIAPSLDPLDAQIRNRLLHLWATRRAPHIGDFLRRPDGSLARIAAKTPRSFQLELAPSTYFFAGWYCSHSGGLSQEDVTGTLIDTGETIDAPAWFFHHDIAGPRRGVTCSIPCRIFRQPS